MPPIQPSTSPDASRATRLILSGASDANTSCLAESRSCQSRVLFRNASRRSTAACSTRTGASSVKSTMRETIDASIETRDESSRARAVLAIRRTKSIREEGLFGSCAQIAPDGHQHEAGPHDRGGHPDGAAQRQQIQSHVDRVPHDAEWAAGRQLMTLVNGCAETPRAKRDERRDHECGAAGDDKRARNALAGKPDGDTPADHGVGHAEVHHRKGEPMERKERAGERSSGLLLRDRSRVSGPAVSPIADAKDYPREAKSAPERPMHGENGSVC